VRFPYEEQICFKKTGGQEKEEEKCLEDLEHFLSFWFPLRQIFISRDWPHSGKPPVSIYLSISINIASHQT
jgi:hypothetical protein